MEKRDEAGNLVLLLFPIDIFFTACYNNIGRYRQIK